MKKYKYLSYVFIALAILLSDVMCAAVAYSYCNMLRGLCSAPASVALLYAIPYAAGIAICVILARLFYKKYHKTTA